MINETLTDLLKYKLLDTVLAVFNPKDLTTLRPEAREFIGRRCTWQASWVIEDGPYKDTWAFIASGPKRSEFRQIGWVPQCDLAEVKTIGHLVDNLPIEVGDIIYVLGDDKWFHEVAVQEVLGPADDYKAFLASDGCRYGVDESYCEVK